MHSLTLLLGTGQENQKFFKRAHVHTDRARPPTISLQYIQNSLAWIEMRSFLTLKSTHVYINGTILLSFCIILSAAICILLLASIIIRNDNYKFSGGVLIATLLVDFLAAFFYPFQTLRLGAMLEQLQSSQVFEIRTTV